MRGPTISVLVAILVGAAGYAAWEGWVYRRDGLAPAEISAIEGLVAARLRDPASARFPVLFELHRNDYAIVACGLVNAKNSYGGYVGAQPFKIHLSANDRSRASYLTVAFDNESARRVRSECENHRGLWD